METKSIGFIGAGRVTRIILQALNNRNVSLRHIEVIDTNEGVSETLKKDYPGINILSGDIRNLLGNDIVFIALHPPAIMETLEKIRHFLDEGTMFVSLAPKITLEKISQNLNGHNKIARLIPNAPSIINEGFNPVSFSDGLSEKEKKLLGELFEKLGKCVVVAEEKLEAYAIITAMSPTYFWFQFQELYNIGRKFGLSDEECREGISNTIKASLDTLFNSGLSYEEVFDLIPVKPISDYEEEISKMYESRLLALFERIKP
jgi:pyrroline-5-carboxylate reductase